MRLTRRALLLLLTPLVLFYVSLFWGRYPIEPLTVLQVLDSRVAPIPATWPPTVETVIVDVRLPRTLLAMLVGAGLSITGAAFQGMFRNPLVSPDILGVSAAAGLGAPVAILLSANAVTIQLAAFAVGLLGVGLTYAISRVYKTTPAIMLVLSGVVVAAFFGALVSGTKYVADPEQKLPAITFWLLGSLASASWASVVTVLPFMAIGTGALLLVRWRINVLSMGDEEARALGVRTEVLTGTALPTAIRGSTSCSPRRRRRSIVRSARRCTGRARTSWCARFRTGGWWRTSRSAPTSRGCATRPSGVATWPSEPGGGKLRDSSLGAPFAPTVRPETTESSGPAP